jgi:hypothetical protein
MGLSEAEIIEPFQQPNMNNLTHLTPTHPIYTV